MGNTISIIFLTLRRLSMWSLIYILFFIPALFSQSFSEDNSRDLIVGEVLGKVDPRDLDSLIQIGYYPVVPDDSPVRYAIQRKEASATRVVYTISYPNDEANNHPDKVVFRFFDSEQSLIGAIITDQVDFALTESRYAAMEVEKSTLAFRIHFRYKPPNYVKLLAYNNRDQVLRSADIRKALTYAIDRNYIIEKLLNQSAYSADGPLSKEADLHAANLDGYKYNPRKARQLLQNENWDDSNRDGILDKYGKPFRVVLTYEKGALLDEQIVRLIKIEWSKLGVDVIRNPLIKSELKKVMAQRNYDVLLMNHQFRETIESFEAFFHSRSRQNILNYRSARVDRYFRRYHLVPEQSQKEIFKEGIQTEINRDHPAAFLFFLWLDHYFVNRVKFSNFQDTKGKLLPFTEWKFTE